MADQDPSCAEVAYQLTILGTAPGEPNSGRARYAAAMYFYQRGMISEECLEVYRICSNFDHENPRSFLLRLSLEHEIEALKLSVRNKGSMPK